MLDPTLIFNFVVFDIQNFQTVWDIYKLIQVFVRLKAHLFTLCDTPVSC
jgi:hypothetical protein